MNKIDDKQMIWSLGLSFLAILIIASAFFSLHLSGDDEIGMIQDTRTAQEIYQLLED